MGLVMKSGVVLLLTFLLLDTAWGMAVINGKSKLLQKISSQQSRMNSLIIELLNSASLETCSLPDGKLADSLADTLDVGIQKLTDIKNKMKCDETTTSKPPTTTSVTTKRVTQCRTLENGDTVCVEAVEDGGVTHIKVIKNDKVIKNTKVPNPISVALETEMEKVVPSTETITKTTTKQVVTQPNGDIIEVEVLEEDGSATVITKKNDAIISQKPTKGKPTSVIEEVVKKYIPQEPTTSPTQKSNKKITQCRTMANGDLICLEAIEEDDATTVTVIKNEKVIKQTKIPGSISKDLEPVFNKIVPTEESVTKKVTRRRTTLPNGDVIEVEVITEDDVTTVITKKNGVVTSKKPTKGDPVTAIDNEMSKYITSETVEKESKRRVVKKCVQPNDEDIICIEVIQEDGKITVTTKKNGKVVDTREDTGDVTEILNKVVRKYVPNEGTPGPSGKPDKPGSKRTTKCVIVNEQESICVETIEEDDKITVITTKNGKVIETREDTGSVTEIINKTLRKHVPDAFDPNGKPITGEKGYQRKTTKCAIINDQETYCVEVIEEDEKITIITKKNGKVIDTKEQTGGNVPDIMNKILKKYISISTAGGDPDPNRPKTPKVSSKCVTLANGEVVCVETTEYSDKTIVKTTQNDKVVDQSETTSTDTITEVIEKTLKKYTTNPQGKPKPTKRVKRCQILDSGERVCVETVIEEDESVTVIITNNDVVVKRKKLESGVDVNEVSEKELREYVTQVISEQTIKSVRTKRRCRYSSTGESYCVEVTQDGDKLTVVVKKNNVVINTRVTKGEINEVIEEELNKVTSTTETSPSDKSGSPKSVTKCGGIENGDNYCVEIIDENGAYTVIVKKNGVVISTTKRQVTSSSQSIMSALNEEFSKYMTMISTSTAATRTTRKCRTFPTGDKVCVEVMEEDGVKTVKTTKNGSSMRTRKSKDALSVIYEKEFEDFKS